jgi:superfamily II DNA or RNA helicase
VGGDRQPYLVGAYMTALTLRPRQEKAIHDLRRSYKNGAVAPILVASTGFGKTATAINMIQNATSKGLRVWFLAHLKEILNDTADRLIVSKIKHGYIWAGHLSDRRQQVQVVSVQTAARRLERLERPDLIICDEAHLAVAGTYQDVFKWAQAGPKYFAKGGAKILHLTATPKRLDGRGMGEVADDIVLTCSTQDLINEGLLAPVRYLTPDTPDMSRAKHLGGEFNPVDTAAIMRKPSIVGSALNHYLKHGRGRPGLGFCVDIASARQFAEEFAGAGLRTMAISGDDHDDTRYQALDWIQNGKLDFVFNCKLWVAGVDAPALSYIADLAPTESLTRYLQGLGRGLRTCDGKRDLIYADHAGNLQRHGNPLMLREWSLDAAEGKRGSGKQEMPVKQCPKCFGTVAAAATVCGATSILTGERCGHEFQTVGRELEQVEGELNEVGLTLQIAAEMKQKKIVRMEQGSAKDRDQLTALFIKRGSTPDKAARRADHVLAGRATRDAREAQIMADMQARSARG